MIKIFKFSYPIQLVLIVLIALVLWAKIFSEATLVFQKSNLSPFYNFLADGLLHWKYVALIFSFLLLLFEALFLNSIMHNNLIVPKNTFLPAFIYVLTISCVVSSYTFHPVLIANLFLIIALSYFYKVYDKEEAYSEVFTTAILISIASFFYFPSAFFLVFIWFGFFVYRIFSWREWFIFIIGLTIPYIFLVFFRFMLDFQPFLSQDYATFFTNQLTASTQLISFKNIFYLYLILIFILSFPKYLSEINDKTIAVRKKSYTHNYFFFISIVTLFFSGTNFENSLGFTILPFSVITGIYFVSSKKVRFPNFLLFTLIILSIIKVYFY